MSTMKKYNHSKNEATVRLGLDSLFQNLGYKKSKIL